jgi:hypothetical protein
MIKNQKKIFVEIPTFFEESSYNICYVFLFIKSEIS